MKTTMAYPKSQRTSEPLKNIPPKGKRLDGKMIVMIEECINRRFCQLKKVQMEEG